MSGETMIMNENLIVASVKPPLEPLTNIKLIFDFCMDAHCFDDIYAKVISTDDGQDDRVNHLKVTSIDQKDRDILKKWISEGS